MPKFYGETLKNFARDNPPAELASYFVIRAENFFPFVNGLIKKKCFDRYLKYVHYAPSSTFECCSDFRVSDAFLWRDTCEGDEYWRDVDSSLKLTKPTRQDAALICLLLSVSNKTSFKELVDYKSALKKYFLDSEPTEKIQGNTTHQFSTNLSATLAKASTQTTKGNTMTTSLLDQTIAANKVAAERAARIKVGKAVLDKILKIAKDKAPIFLKGYLDTPVAALVLANALKAIVEAKFSTNEKAVYVANAAIEAAMFITADSFNVDEMLESFLDIIIPVGVECL